MSQQLGRARPDTNEARLARLLDSPHLARVVPHLAPELLHHLIRQRGLDACGDLVTAATRPQLTAVFDLDLWRRSDPGRDERFDADRFADWLDLLADSGDAAAARILAEMDVDLVVAGLSQHVRVFDPGVFEPTASSDDEPMDWGPVRSDVTCELGGYLVMAKRHDAWDAILTLLVALEAERPHSFHEVMQGCRRTSNDAPEIDGLDELLMTPDQLLHDITLEREQRRSQQGYSTPADARAFLEMARRARRDRSAESPSVNPIVAAYFRAADEATTAAGDVLRLSQPVTTSSTTSEEAGDVIDTIAELLADADLMAEKPRALLESGTSSSRLAHIRSQMEHVRETDEAAWRSRSRELAFLANTLVAGGSVQSRPFTPAEASDAVAAICNLGLEQWPARWPGAERRDAASTAGDVATLPDAFLAQHDLVTAFEVGWSTLHEDVCVDAARQLMLVLGELRSVDAEFQDDLRALRLALRTHCDAGTPWRARGALDVIATLDTAAWIALLGVLDECPVLPEALMAILEGRKGAVSATTFEFFSSTAQIEAVRRFMARLPDLLRA